MNTINNVIKYNSLSIKKAALILSGVMLGIAVLTKAMVISFSNGRSIGNQSFNGFEITFAIFLFVGFIAMFSSNFNHMNICGVTRKAFYAGNILFSLVAAAGMLALFGILTVIYTVLGIDVSSIVITAYKANSVIVIAAFSASLFLLSAMAGWLLSLLGYRFGTPMIIALAVSPGVVLTIAPVIVMRLGLGKVAFDIVKFYFGFLNEPSALLASLNFLGTAVLLALVNWLIMRKLPVKM